MIYFHLNFSHFTGYHFDLNITDEKGNVKTKTTTKRKEDRDLYDDEDENLLCLCRCYPCCIISCLKNITKVYNDKAFI